MMPKESWEERNKANEILTTDKIQREKIMMQVDGKKGEEGTKRRFVEVRS